MQICVLGSGSGGNCTYVSTGRVSILIDVGFGSRSLARRWRETGLDGRNIAGVFLTHGHCDHFSGVLAFASERGIPVFLTAGTLTDVPALEQLPAMEILRPGCPVAMGDLCVTPFAISHDASEPVGFRLEAAGIAGALATDLGEITPEVALALQDCDWLVLESNHDENLLRLGSYPWPLKQRLLSRIGHLSNQALAAFLSHSFDGHAAHILLAHLSQQNNHPLLAFDTAVRALGQRSETRTWNVHLTDQKKPSIVVNL
jgi:phosphoribosyl 1,2-cyclic phosphodiesterase